jgi:hypothetical protein
MGHRWKSLFTGVNSLRAGWINGVTDRENEILKEYCCFAQLLLLIEFYRTLELLY